LLGKDPLDAEKIAEARAIGSEVVGWRYTDLNADSIAAAHAAGLKVWSYTVDKPEEARKLAEPVATIVDEAHFEWGDVAPGKEAIGVDDEGDGELHLLSMVEIGRVRRDQVDDSCIIIVGG